MERIGPGRVGISRISRHIFVVGRSCGNLSGDIATLPVSLTTILTDRQPNICLEALRPRKARKNVTQSAAAAASPEVSFVGSVTDNDTCKLRTQKSEVKVPSRRRSKSTGSGLKSSTAINNLELQRLAGALEIAYHKAATTSKPDHEDSLEILEVQTTMSQSSGGAEAVYSSPTISRVRKRSKLPSDVGPKPGTETVQALEVQMRTSQSSDDADAVSCSSPTVSRVRKRRVKLPNEVLGHTSGNFVPRNVISPQNTEDGFIVRSVPLAGVKKRVGKRKCRLNLGSRISLRKKRQNVSQLSDDTCSDFVKAREDIWCAEAERLIMTNGMVLDLGIVDWDNLQRGLLTAELETQLALLMTPMKALKKLRKTLREGMGRDPSDEEWATAAKLDEHTLHRYLLLGKSARNKLVQHNLRLVLSQAHRYHKERSNLTIYDLCQEGVSGLLHGVDKFEQQRGHRFSTYAVYWVRNSILRAQTRSGGSLRAPYNMGTHKMSIRRARLDLQVELQRVATDEEVRKRLGFTAARFRNILRSSPRLLSLYRRSLTTGEELVETIADPSDFKRWGHFWLDDVLDSLKPRESLVLRQRFGLDGKGQRTLQEIGQSLGLSREMVRKYEICAMMKMKHPTRMDQIRSYFSL